MYQWEKTNWKMYSEKNELNHKSEKKHNLNMDQWEKFSWNTKEKM